MTGSFSEEALQLFEVLVRNLDSEDYAEVVNTYDFTRCVRADGSAYGTRGSCRKGTEEAKSAEAPAKKARTSRMGSKDLDAPARAAGVRAKQASKTLKEAVREFKQAERALKKDKSPEAKARYKEALKAANAADRANNKAEREWSALSSRYHKARRAEERAQMSPERRREERRLERQIREMG